MTIEVLSPSVAAKIAAGEVIERPASVVKELVENAIDAGATSIKVTIEQGGTRSIEVTDNGAGIPADQIVLAFNRHATSKLRTAEDLESIGTLGFRGEALPSIAAVSILTCTSCTPDADAGTRLSLRFGVSEDKPRAVGTAPGTSIKVEDLFSNQPARLKFLKTKPTEAAQVQRVVARYAMAYPKTRFQFVNDGRENLLTNGTGDLRETILQIWGNDTARQTIPVLLQTSDVNVSGYIGNTDLHRSNRNDIAITVNGRWIQDRNLSWAIEQGYNKSLPQGRRPVAVIDLELPPNLVDVNAHPTKQEVRFRYESKIFSAVQRAVKESLSTHGLVQQPTQRPFGSNPGTYRPPPIRRTDPVYIEPDNDDTRETNPRRDARSVPKTGRTETTNPLNETPPLVTTDTAPHVNLRLMLPKLRLIGQAQLTFILADGPDGLYVLDQHAAHERVIYDRVIQTRDSQPAPSQHLMLAEQARLDEFQEKTLIEHEELIREHGFQFNRITDQIWDVTAIPEPFTQQRNPNPVNAFQKMLDEFAAEQIVSSPNQAISATIACHSAARAGDRLGDAQMKAIIKQLAETPEPHQCPHGRPTIIQLSKLRLEQEFRRR